MFYHMVLFLRDTAQRQKQQQSRSFRSGYGNLQTADLAMPCPDRARANQNAQLHSHIKINIIDAIDRYTFDKGLTFCFKRNECHPSR